MNSQIENFKNFFERKSLILILSSFSKDFLVNYLSFLKYGHTQIIIDENTDTNWIYNEDISDKLSRQKETEKEDLINDLEGQTSEKRNSTVEMQNAGIINWFKDFSKKNLDRIKEEKYSETLQEERLNKIKELLLTKQSEMEVSEQFGVNAELLLGCVGEEPMDPINEEGYNQFDEDREEEGDDDGDHDGDYREN